MSLQLRDPVSWEEPLAYRQREYRQGMRYFWRTGTITFLFYWVMLVVGVAIKIIFSDEEKTPGWQGPLVALAFLTVFAAVLGYGTAYLYLWWDRFGAKAHHLGEKKIKTQQVKGSVAYKEVKNFGVYRETEEDGGFWLLAIVKQDGDLWEAGLPDDVTADKVKRRLSELLPGMGIHDEEDFAIYYLENLADDDKD